MWVLKQDVHRGKGVHVMTQQDAIHEVHLPLTLSATPANTCCCHALHDHPQSLPCVGIVSPCLWSTDASLDFSLIAASMLLIQ